MFSNVNLIQRVSVLETDYYILKNDIDLFFSYKEKDCSETKFIALIIKNYFDIAECSFNKDSMSLQELNNKLRFLSDTDKKKTIKILEKFLIEQKIENFKHFFNQNNKISSKRISLTNNLQTKISNLECGDYYKDDLKIYLRYLIHEYAILSKGKRERIIFRELINNINVSIKDSKKIYVETYNDSNKYIVRPIGTIEDPKTQFNYLCGYAQKQGDDKEEYKTFRIYRIKTITILSNKYTITKKEKEIKNINNPTYYGEKRTYRVELTEEGYKMYKEILHLRPSYTQIISNNNSHILEFTSSEREIYNYFFKFGAECKILEPMELHNRFQREYEMALKKYTQDA